MGGHHRGDALIECGDVVAQSGDYGDQPAGHDAGAFAYSCVPCRRHGLVDGGDACFDLLLAAAVLLVEKLAQRAGMRSL